MDNQIHNAIVSFIWGIADDCLRDVYVRGKYRDVILPMTVIRRLDVLLEDTKEAVLNLKKQLTEAKIDNQYPALCHAAGQAFCNASPFRLRDLTSRPTKQKLKADFEAYLDGFSPNVQEILDKFKAEHISYGSTLSIDGNATRQFDFMLSNPPYGKSWKTDAEKMASGEDEKKKKKEILDTRFNTYLPNGENLSMIPRSSDGQLLFLLNNVSKMKDPPLGSHIAEVHNGSSIFTGDAGSGESNARRYMIENDLVEAIIAVPENMFYNTGIGTFIWILSNRKEERRKGKIQLIDATGMKSALRKNMGKKNCEFTEDIRKEILRIFLDMEESEVSKIFNNEDFAYWSIVVERPLRLRIFPEREIPAGTFKKTADLAEAQKAIGAVPKDTPLDDWTAFAKATKLKATALKKIRPFITEKDETAKAIDGEPDVELRDTENVPFTYEGGIDAFMKNKVLTYAPDAWVDESRTQIGYEISFTKYFYKPQELREMKEILADLTALEKEADGMMAEIMRGIE